jgi:DNA-directed RNA polymerase subunit RPC12/RpoP
MTIKLTKEHKDLIRKSEVYICDLCKKQIKDHEQFRCTNWKEDGEVKSEYRHIKCPLDN